MHCCKCMCKCCKVTWCFILVIQKPFIFPCPDSGQQAASNNSSNFTSSVVRRQKRTKLGQPLILTEYRPDSVRGPNLILIELLFAIETAFLTYIWPAARRQKQLQIHIFCVTSLKTSLYSFSVNLILYKLVLVVFWQLLLISLLSHGKYNENIFNNLNLVSKATFFKGLFYY